MHCSFLFCCYIRAMHRTKGGKVPFSADGRTIKEMAEDIARAEYPEELATETAQIIADASPDIATAASRLAHLRRFLREAGGSLGAIESTKMPDITAALNSANRFAQSKRIVEGLRPPLFYCADAVEQRLEEYDVEAAPRLQAAIDVMIAMCARPAELSTLNVIGDTVSGFAKGRGAGARPLLSMVRAEGRAAELLEWIQGGIANGIIPNPGKPGVKAYRTFLAQHKLKPSDLRKLGAEYAVRAHGGTTDAHRMGLRRLALRHADAGRPSAAEHYAIVL